LEPVRQLLHGIDLDPCTESDNPTGARRFYALPYDGLELSWESKSVCWTFARFRTAVEAALKGEK
jgi:hypothetical protein